jgi:hypothetical protein
MPRWKVLPESLDPGVRRLVVHMRQLKDHRGLSFGALAARTPYSRSSWERYLNGKALPPRGAVEALAEVCGGDRTQLTALWEVAARAEQTTTPEVGDVPVEDVQPSRQHRGRVPLLAGLAVVVLAVAVALLVNRPWESPDPPGGTTAAAASVPTSGASLRSYPCHYEVRDGRQYAGHSTTLTQEYGVGVTEEAVAEVQCLVKKYGFDPQGVDGSFGPNTKAAVQAFQRSRGLDDDGIVGPRTWRELRKVTHD